MKRIFSLMLAALLLVSAIPTALATNDYSQGTQVVYTATGSESYTITVPAQLAPGGSGTVTLSGTWADNRIVTVTADPTVTLKNSIKETDTKTLNVNFGGISEAGSNTTSQTFTKDISVGGITDALFGTWSGKFNYNVEVGTSTNIANYSYNGLVLPESPTNDEYPYIYLIKCTDEVLETELTAAGMTEYIGQVDVGYYLQLTTHPRTHKLNEGGQDMLLFEQGKMLTYGYFEGLDGWIFAGERDAAERTSCWVFGNMCTLAWCNNDVLKADGTVYLAASAPVPVYE